MRAANQKTMQLNSKELASLAFVIASFAIHATAGEMTAETTPIAPEPKPAKGWCDALKSIGSLYDNADNPVISKFALFGRFQYQAAYLDGEDVNGLDYDDTYDEYRRVRIGAKAELFQHLTLKANINLVNDGRPSGSELDWGYQSFDIATLTFDIQKAFGLDGLDELAVSYGRQKFNLSQEARTSSTKILTPERSAISNKVYGSYRPTGVLVGGVRGRWSGLLGIFSTEVDEEFIAGWGEGQAYQARLGYAVTDNLILFGDVVYADNEDGGEDDIWDYEWATSLSAEYSQGRFGLNTDVIYGDNGDQAAERDGDFWGFVAIPYYWLVEDRLQLVGRYAYQGSEEDEGIRVNSRYLRRQHDDNNVDLNGGRGDSHHAIYAGLNYYLCGHNAKVFAGLEYDDFDTPAGDADSLTYWLGFRSYF
jgi:hypothetical protein